ncbi:hypothetical protein HKBW3S03_00704 [Candidatus Hakubella thermalkaliphila]|uniref:Uncharacterized protein n=1 Tax=Candidatus Hakubella thermalkaliphila TaxID=2754717 RepID=A0A6V8Q2W9_9ACTN|nr:hypothetical protein [Actinomycetota bacterium]GFP19199.1 hypothetical protein HKBW3S03_00704 [Candidatus Hakubella thermalkaliphila]GFP30631.1 hypothetical protein HKBW3S34_01551 [Candidatus Hakubella thermalkaliphila]GFP39058.1 hypothetical protein HKBW3S47_00758 [Candidatus Hakubella thermalkaliphila]
MTFRFDPQHGLIIIPTRLSVLTIDLRVGTLTLEE